MTRHAKLTSRQANKMDKKTIIVTGASRGLGLAIAEYLLHEGHNVVALARSKGPLDELQAKYPKQARALAADLADFSFANKAAELALQEFGAIHGLVFNHATLGPLAKIADMNAEDWKAGLDINVCSAIAFAHATLPELRKTKGRLILTSTGAAIKSYQTLGFYGASKAALRHIGQTLGEEEPDVITLSVAPGTVDTEMQKNIRESGHSMHRETHEYFQGLFNEGKLLEPEQPGNVMARLVLECPREFSGKSFRWNDSELAAFQDK